MCERHSFCLTRAAKVIDGYGLTESHTKIASIAGIESKEHDALAQFEWQPPAGWPEAALSA